MIFIATQYSFNLAIGGFSVKSHVTAEIQDARIVALDETYFSKASEFAQFEQVQLGMFLCSCGSGDTIAE